MKKSVTFKFNKLVISLLTLVTVLMAVCCLATFSLPVFADESQPRARLFSPSTSLEYASLSSPTAIYHDDEVTAIIENAETIKIYKDGEFITVDTSSLNEIMSIKRKNQTQFYFSAGARLFSYDFVNNVTQQIILNENDMETVSYFDFNDEYVITAYQNCCNLYKIDENFTKITLNTDIGIADGSNVAINDLNELFVVTKNGVYRTTPDSPYPLGQPILNGVIPQKIIANDNFVYYLLNNEIYQMGTDGSNAIRLTTPQTAYDLGKIDEQHKPTNLAFNGDNLLLIINDTVQEFKVNQNVLEFTGFAIAQNKTAYNRVSKNASQVQTQADKVAVLDANRLTVVTQNKLNQYESQNYNNVTFENDVPNYFALGKDTAFLSYNNGVINGPFALLDLSTNQISEKQSFNGNIIYDVCYQSGYYYALTSNGTTTEIYKISEQGLTANQPIFTTNTLASKMAIDVFGNIYLATDSQIHAFKLSADKTYSTQPTSSISLALVKKMSTDLFGRVFALADGNLWLLNTADENITAENVSPLPVNAGGKIESFALGFDKKDVYLLYDNEEFISCTDELSNYALSTASASDEIYKLSATSAQDGALKVYSVNEGANVYSVNRNSDKLTFTYNGLTEAENQYIEICQIIYNQTENLKLTALAGQKGVVFVNSNELTQIDADTFTQPAPAKAYTTTEVNMYFIPIITQNLEDKDYPEYALFDQQVVRLAKHLEFSPTKKITILDKEFYFALATVGDKQYTGYIPVSFTVEVLSEDFVWDTFTFEHVKKCSYYQDQSLTVKLGEFNENQKVKVVETQNGVCKVMLDDGSLVYISQNQIKDQPNVTIRNILIILAVTASVCGTATCFILRKKD